VEETGHLHVAVENTGAWVEPDNIRSLSTGILNLRRRLELIYGDAARFSLGRGADGVFARISIPTGGSK
jgi:LytS/YehU family sensor histidine kinase